MPEWAASALKRLSIPATILRPVVFDLPNGLKLIVQPESVSNTVNVYGHVLNRPELQTPEGKEGADQVLDQLFSYGTTSLDRLDFQKALDDIAASETAGTELSRDNSKAPGIWQAGPSIRAFCPKTIPCCARLRRKPYRL